jgi:hypothetical protein
MQVVPFLPIHLTHLTLQTAQAAMQPYFTTAYKEVLHNELSFTAIDDKGAIIGCAGLVKEDKTRAYAWVLLGKNSASKLFFFHKKIQSLLDLSHYDRIETIVESHFTQGQRWMKLLNFEYEGEMKHFFGMDHHVKLYAYFPKLNNRNQEK